MPPLIDLTGQTFGRLTVLGRGTNIGRAVRWRCQCSCGRQIDVTSYRLTVGQTKSCRCINRDRFIEQNTSHGLARTREHVGWLAAKQRCYQPGHASFHNYGARGITMAECWRNDFQAFLSAVGPCPKGWTLDRIDSNGNYEPGNCRWASLKQQGENKRNNHVIEHAGRKMHISDWAKYVGIDRMTIKERLQRGWSVERALTEPARPMRHLRPSKP